MVGGRDHVDSYRESDRAGLVWVRPVLILVSFPECNTQNQTP